MLLADLTSSTLIALTLTETVGLLVGIVAFIIGIMAYIRKDERDKSRLDQNERDIARLIGLVERHEVSRIETSKDLQSVMHTVQELAVRMENIFVDFMSIHNLKRANARRSPPKPKP